MHINKWIVLQKYKLWIQTQGILTFTSQKQGRNNQWINESIKQKSVRNNMLYYPSIES